jgi:hypothetical protein
VQGLIVHDLEDLVMLGVTQIEFPHEGRQVHAAAEGAHFAVHHGAAGVVAAVAAAHAAHALGHGGAARAMLPATRRVPRILLWMVMLFSLIGVRVRGRLASSDG